MLNAAFAVGTPEVPSHLAEEIPRSAVLYSRVTITPSIAKLDKHSQTAYYPISKAILVQKYILSGNRSAGLRYTLQRS